MRNILILGAGKSSIALIDYLIEHAQQEEWYITVADVTADAALHKTKGRAHTTAKGFNLQNDEERKALIAKADIVVSMLPAAFHLTIAKDCIALKKNLVTPSYISDAMKAMNDEVAHNDLIFMNETGLDPGIDHMSAMELIEGLQARGCQITGFKSNCGGLIAPVSDNNPWHYKFTWNPRNVVLAGQGEGKIRFRKNGELNELSYEQLFSSAYKIDTGNYGVFESYPNRDSLKYISEYGLDEVATMYRGTLRVPPFCAGWNCLVKLGLTLEKEIPVTSIKKEEAEILNYLGINTATDEYQLLKYLELFERLKILTDKTVVPSVFLQKILEEKWQLKPGDKDMVVMVHEIDYVEAGKSKKLQSSLVYTGKDEEHTAMAITVGLPVAMITKAILNKQVNRRGVLMPKYAEIYTPVLKELKQYGISFTEHITELAN